MDSKKWREELSGMSGLYGFEDSIVDDLSEVEEEVKRLRKALQYARRFVKPKDVDIEYIDAVLRGEKHE